MMRAARGGESRIDRRVNGAPGFRARRAFRFLHALLSGMVRVPVAGAIVTGLLIYADGAEEQDAVRDREHLVARYSSSISSTQYAPDGSSLAFATEGGMVGILPRSGNTVPPTSQYRAMGAITTCVAFSPDGKLLAGGGADDGSIFLWNASDGREIRRFAGHATSVRCLRFSPDGRILASGDITGRVRLWSTKDGNSILDVMSKGGSVRNVAFLPGSAMFAAAGVGGKVEFWDIHAGVGADPSRLTLDLKKWLTGIVFAPDGKSMIAACLTTGISSWDLSGHQLMWKIENPGESVLSLGISPDGRILATGELNGKIRLWDLDTRRLARTIDAHYGAVMTLSFSPDGATLVSGGRDGAVRRWQVRSAESGPASRQGNVAGEKI